MYHDICSGPIGLSTSAARSEWNHMIRAFLAHSAATPDHLGKVLETEPDVAMPWAAKGLFCLMLGRREMIAIASECHTKARRSSAASEREELWVAALGAWLDGHPSRAIAAMEQILAQYPTDTFSAKVSHAIRFILGDAKGMRRSVERILPSHANSHPLQGYLLGCHAFTLEETGEFTAAERVGLAGLDLASDDAWGLHAVAHVHDMTARPADGVSLIEANQSAWNHCNNFRYHVWWHKALLHMELGELGKALDLYDQQIRVDKTDDYRDIANATSLLMRLELEGLDVGNRWEELAAYAENRTRDGCLVFADLHYMLALGGAGKFCAAGELALRFTSDARIDTEMNTRVADPGIAALTGLHSFAEGRYDTAFLNLARARPTMQTIGGSHAQRDVFEKMTVDAGIRAGFLDQAADILAERLALRAGHEDMFTATRFAKIDRARQIAAQ